MELGILISFFYLITSIFCTAPTVTVGDVSELAGAANNLGIAHAPGYPLFVLIYKFISYFIPFANIGYRLNLVSIILGSLSVFLLYYTVYSVARKQSIALLSVFFSFSSAIILKQNLVVEVFALHNVIILLIIVFLFILPISIFQKIIITAMIFGLGLGNQHILLLILPSLFFYFLFLGYKKFLRIDTRFVFIIFLFFILGLSIYLFIPLRSLKEPLYDWEDPQNFDRFWFLVSRARYGTFSLAQGGKFSFTPYRFYKGVQMFLELVGLPYAVIMVVIVLFLLTILGYNLTKVIINNKVKNFSKKNNKSDGFEKGSKAEEYQINTEQNAILTTSDNSILYSFIIFLFFAVYFQGPFIISISGLSNLSQNTTYILERLINSSILLIGILLGLCFYIVFKDIYIKFRYLIYFLSLIFLVLFVKNLFVYSLRNSFFLYDYILNIMKYVPKNSQIFADRADETEFGFSFFQRALKKRQDIEFIDCNASISRSIYGENYYKIWGQQRLKIRSDVEKTIIKKRDKEIYYLTVLPAQTEIEKFRYGLMFAIEKKPLSLIFYYLFNFRNSNFTNIREYNLYLSCLDLLGNYYFENTKSEDEAFDIFKVLFYEIFLITKNSNYLLYVPYKYFSFGKYQLAEREYKKILEYPLSIELSRDIYNNLGIISEKLLKYDEAKKYYEKAIYLDNNFEQGYYNLGLLFWKLNDYKNSIKLFQMLLKINPTRSEVENYINILRQKE